MSNKTKQTNKQTKKRKQNVRKYHDRNLSPCFLNLLTSNFIVSFSTTILENMNVTSDSSKYFFK